MARPRHSKAEIEEALKYAESKEWRVKVDGGQAWGKLYCPFNGTKIVETENFALCASGVPQQVRVIMGGKFAKRSILALSMKNKTIKIQYRTMKNYDFTLKFSLTDSGLNPEICVD